MQKRPGTKRLALSALLRNRYPDVHPDKLYAAVLCGHIRVNGERIRDPKRTVFSDVEVQWKQEKYVGRGGYKLESALDSLDLSPEGLVCLDAGASTGGFTDCLLSRGALLVHAVDVGFNQLAWKLRRDERVIVREKTNLMDLDPDSLLPPPRFAVADLSFRSLRGAASHLLKLTAGGIVLALVKPQFENPIEEDFDGVVRSSRAREDVIEALRNDLEQENVYVHDAVVSAITGRRGNAEIFFLLSDRPSPDGLYAAGRIRAALNAADRLSGTDQKSSRPNGAPTQKPSPPR